MEGDDSDSDSGQNLGLDKTEDLSREGEGEMHIQSCSILLNRLEAERDEMNRKSGIPKPASRIPTFHKKTTTAEGPRARPAEARERSLPAPSVRSPFPSSDVAAETVVVVTHAVSSAAAVPKTLPSESYLSASPRPAIRPDRASHQQLPDRTRTGTEIRTGTGSGSEEEEEREEAAGERYGFRKEERKGKRGTETERATTKKKKKRESVRRRRRRRRRRASRRSSRRGRTRLWSSGPKSWLCLQRTRTRLRSQSPRSRTSSL
ncbi:uncharacterized protein LOC129410709 isoform X2 [Boleophthalmus pectinirostris]|uniref:uncharacterized protein LOC129410709 isoform X2 n=1 Tax=Boleophthalmus pectinirostris TaxID=150288 RepID=UPI00242DF6E8|nr:uncharacterized protein LOC129410709 isoform X2 [Boleophthalmus pectinirostris]